MDVQLRVVTTTPETSDWSIPVTFFCASEPGAPAAPTVLLAEQELIQVQWDLPTDNGGSSVLGFPLGHSSLSESVKFLGRNFDSLDGNALGDRIELLYNIIFENELKLLQLSSQDTWLDAFEFADVASNYLTVVDDIVVFATLVDE